MPGVESTIASVGSLALWVVAPIVVAWGAAAYFLDLDSHSPGVAPAWSAIAWYLVLAVLVLLTGVANRHADVGIGVTVTLVAIEFGLVSLVTAVLWPLAVLDRHPFLGAATDPLSPVSDLPQSVERWLSSAMTGYPVLIALVITVLRAVASRRGWTGRSERLAIYVAFAAMIVVGVAAIVAVGLLHR